MEAAARTKTEKSAPSSVECEGFANSFLRLQGYNVLCRRVERLIKNITCKLFAICVKQSARSTRICGRTKIILCTMIMPMLIHRCLCANYWSKITHLWYRNHRIPQTWLLVTFLFPKQKRPIKGRRCATIEEIKTTSKEGLNKIIKNDFLKCFENWKKRWHKCIISDGDYFEGDNIDIYK